MIRNSLKKIIFNKSLSNNWIYINIWNNIVHRSNYPKNISLLICKLILFNAKHIILICVKIFLLRVQETVIKVELHDPQQGINDSTNVLIHIRASLIRLCVIYLWQILHKHIHHVKQFRAHFLTIDYFVFLV